MLWKLIIVKPIYWYTSIYLICYTHARGLKKLIMLGETDPQPNDR